MVTANAMDVLLLLLVSLLKWEYMLISMLWVVLIVPSVMLGTGVCIPNWVLRKG
jgi:hypothetical protein